MGIFPYVYTSKLAESHKDKLVFVFDGHHAMNLSELLSGDGVDCKFEFIPNEDGTFTMKPLLVVNNVVKNEDYVGEGFEYIQVFGEETGLHFISSVDYANAGVYENQRLQEVYPDGEESMEVNGDVYVSLGEYIEPHVSLCRDDNTVKYNKGNITIKWHEYGSLEGTGVELSIDGTQYSLRPEEQLTVKRPSEITVLSVLNNSYFYIYDQDYDYIGECRWGADFPLSIPIPLTATKLLFVKMWG